MGGEGKTLIAVLPAFFNALTKNSVHVVTVSEYLAKRDALLVAPIYQFLGLRVGLVTENLSISQKKANYMCNVVYLTNNQLGFDYLRDNMARSNQELVQGELEYCVVDELDSILLDEARTPLIITEKVKNKE